MKKFLFKRTWNLCQSTAFVKWRGVLKAFLQFSSCVGEYSWITPIYIYIHSYTYLYVEYIWEPPSTYIRLHAVFVAEHNTNRISRARVVLAVPQPNMRKQIQALPCGSIFPYFILINTESITSLLAMGNKLNISLTSSHLSSDSECPF